MSRDKAIRKMLDTIEEEVRLTRHYIKRDHLSAAVMDAMAAVPRERFVPDEVTAFAYQNGPLPIGHGQTISQPYIVALMTDLLALAESDTVLEVGTGSGYQTAVLSHLVRQVYTIERIDSLAVAACERFRDMEYSNIEACTGDGYEGWPEHAPYDGIIVTAAAPEIPAPLIEQLKPGARLVIPVGDSRFSQQLLVVSKDADGSIHTEPVLSVAFVPMLHGKE